MAVRLSFARTAQASPLWGVGMKCLSTNIPRPSGPPLRVRRWPRDQRFFRSPCACGAGPSPAPSGRLPRRATRGESYPGWERICERIFVSPELSSSQDMDASHHLDLRFSPSFPPADHCHHGLLRRWSALPQGATQGAARAASSRVAAAAPTPHTFPKEKA